MTDTPDLPQWRCHKLVRAAKITGFTERRDTRPGLWKLESGETIEVTIDRRARVPDAVFTSTGGIGGYFVRYEPDGYESWSPAKAFEDGYTLLSGDPINDVALAYMADAVVAFDAAWPKDEHHTRVRRICRALCQKEGYQPDDMVMGGRGWAMVPTMGPNQCQYIRYPLHPVWATYIHRVEDVLTIFHEEA